MERHLVYCDESCQTGRSRYMVIGALVVPQRESLGLQHRISQWRLSENMLAELKWTKVSSGRIGQYRSLVDLAFEELEAKRCEFKALVVDRHKVDWRKYHAGDPDLALYKFYHQLLLHSVCPRIPRGGRLDVYVDQKLSSVSLGDVRSYLNICSRRDYGHDGSLVRLVEPVDSHTCCPMQLCDFLMGAVGYHCNDGHLVPKTRAAKIEIAERIAGRAGHPLLTVNTPRGVHDFVIWRWKPKVGNEKSAPAPRPLTTGDPRGVSAT